MDAITIIVLSIIGCAAGVAISNLFKWQYIWQKSPKKLAAKIYKLSPNILGRKYMKCQEKSPKNMLFEIYRKSPNFLSEQISPAAAYFYDKNRFLSDFNAFLCYMKDFIPITWIFIY